VNLYLTFEDKSKIKKCFLNLRKYLIINIDEIIDKFGFSEDNLDDCHAFIINEEILRLVKDGSSGRKLLSIVYSNPRMNDDIIRSMIHHAETLKNIEKVVFLVEKGKQEEYYELFEEVLFFPTLKKVHIIECQPLPVIWLDRQEEFENLNLKKSN
jgi:hypothetical protein